MMCDYRIGRVKFRPLQLPRDKSFHISAPNSIKLLVVAQIVN
jgi:hypothetical protein